MFQQLHSWIIFVRKSIGGIHWQALDHRPSLLFSGWSRPIVIFRRKFIKILWDFYTEIIEKKIHQRKISKWYCLQWWTRNSKDNRGFENSITTRSFALNTNLNVILTKETSFSPLQTLQQGKPPGLESRKVLVCCLHRCPDEVLIQISSFSSISALIRLQDIFQKFQAKKWYSFVKMLYLCNENARKIPLRATIQKRFINSTAILT